MTHDYKSRYQGLLLLLLIIASILIPSCSIISFDPSSYREDPPKTIHVAEDLRISSTGAVWMNMAGLVKTDFMTSGFKIEYKDRVIYIDPVAVDDSANADYIFITHNHPDHFSVPDIERLSKDSTVIICPRTAMKKLEHFQVIRPVLHEPHDLGDIRFEAVESYNLKRGFFHMPLHKKSGDYLGYIITCGNSRIYHAGDTDFIPEMKDLEDITIALVPVGEGKTAMDPHQAARAVNSFHPAMAVPMHYEMGLNREQDFADSVDSTIIVEFLIRNIDGI